MIKEGAQSVRFFTQSVGLVLIIADTLRVLSVFYNTLGLILRSFSPPKVNLRQDKSC